MSKPASVSYVQCPVGTAESSSADSLQCVVCPAGTFSAAVGSAICSPCAAGQYSAAPGSGLCLRCPFNAVPAANSTTCKCSAGYVGTLFNATAAELECLACPGGADCTQAGSVTRSLGAQPGHFRGLQRAGVSADAWPRFLPCHQPAACLGQGECLRGYTGATCTVCDVGFGRTGEVGCETCPSTGGNWLLVLTFLGLALAFSGMAVWSSLKVRVGVEVGGGFLCGRFELMLSLTTCILHIAQTQNADVRSVVFKLSLSGVQLNAVAR